jgi:hypothetical protein
VQIEKSNRRASYNLRKVTIYENENQPRSQPGQKKQGTSVFHHSVPADFIGYHPTVLAFTHLYAVAKIDPPHDEVAPRRNHLYSEMHAGLILDTSKVENNRLPGYRNQQPHTSTSGRSSNA